MCNFESQKNDLADFLRINWLAVNMTGILVRCVIALAVILPGAVWAMGLDFPPQEPPPEVTQRPVIDRIGGLKSPSRMALSDGGDIYVSDTTSGIVAAFNHDGERVGTIKGLNSPLGIALHDFETTIEVEIEECVLIYNQEEKIRKLKEKIRKTEEKLERALKSNRIAKLEAKIARLKERLAELKAKAGTQKPLWIHQLKEIRKIEQQLEHALKSNRIAKLEDKIARLKKRLAELEADTRTECTVTMVPKLVTITRVYVGDDGDGSVRIFDNGRLTGSLGSGSGEFLKPNGIAVASDGTVFVVDSLVHQIAVYNQDGILQFSFGSQGSGDGNLLFPTDIAINESVGELYVSDFENGRVVVFGLDGTWSHHIWAPANSKGDPAFYRAAGISIDPDGNLYVTDNALSCLVIMSSTGQLLDIIGYDADVAQYWTGDLLVPIDSVSDGTAVWVSSSRNGKINVYEVNH